MKQNNNQLKLNITDKEFKDFVEKHQNSFNYFTDVGQYPILITSHKRTKLLVTWFCQYKPCATGFTFTVLASKHTDVLKATSKALLKQQNEVVINKDFYKELIVERYDENF